MGAEIDRTANIVRKITFESDKRFLTRHKEMSLICYFWVMQAPSL